MTNIIYEIEIGDMKLSVIDANFPKDENILLPHFHPMFEFQYVLQSSVKIKTNETAYDVHEGCYALIPPNLFHWTNFDKVSFKRFAFLFSVSPLKKGGDFSEYEHYRKIFESVTNIAICDNPQIGECLNSIIAIANENNNSDIHVLKIYFSLLFVKMAEDVTKLMKLEGKEAVSDRKNTDKDLKLRSVIGEYVITNYAKENVLASLSEILHMSTRNTSRTVKKLFGVTLGTLVLNQRMNFARTHIKETDIPIRLVAELAGYNDYSAFFKTFKKQFGCSPDSLRNIANKDKKI
ncbi:MAG: helix-turn-helix transcriptional regulator [Clostridia bacterium]|nr:helix-turn-helix transcriptional regulator [Clostridia bacterium]